MTYSKVQYCFTLKIFILRVVQFVMNLCTPNKK